MGKVLRKVLAVQHYLARRWIRILLLIAAAVLTAVVVTIGLALLAHEVLVRTVGQDAIQTRDLRGLLIVGGAYAAGAISALAVFVIGWRRFVRGRG